VSRTFSFPDWKLFNLFKLNLLKFFDQLLHRRLQDQLRVLGWRHRVGPNVWRRVELAEAEGENKLQVFRHRVSVADEVKGFHVGGDDKDALDALIIDLKEDGEA